VGLSDLDTNNYQRINQYKNSITLPELQISQTNCAKRRYPQYNDQTPIKHEIRQCQKRLSPEEIRQVVTAYKHGATVYELAAQFNCHRNTISKNLKQSGVKPTTKKFVTQNEIGELAALYTSGKKLDEIAKQYGVGASTVRKVLINNGVTMRTRWDY
jgi:transposase-like protein